MRAFVVLAVLAVVLFLRTLHALACDWKQKKVGGTRYLGASFCVIITGVIFCLCFEFVSVIWCFCVSRDCFCVCKVCFLVLCQVFCLWVRCFINLCSIRPLICVYNLPALRYLRAGVSLGTTSCTFCERL